MIPIRGYEFSCPFSLVYDILARTAVKFYSGKDIPPSPIYFMKPCKLVKTLLRLRFCTDKFNKSTIALNIYLDTLNDYCITRSYHDLKNKIKQAKHASNIDKRFYMS